MWKKILRRQWMTDDVYDIIFILLGQPSYLPVTKYCTIIPTKMNHEYGKFYILHFQNSPVENFT